MVEVAEILVDDPVGQLQVDQVGEPAIAHKTAQRLIALVEPMKGEEFLIGQAAHRHFDGAAGKQRGDVGGQHLGVAAGAVDVEPLLGREAAQRARPVLDLP